MDSHLLFWIQYKLTRAILFIYFPVFSAYGSEERPRGKVTKLTSGDDLEDDFTIDVQAESKEVAPAPTDLKDIDVKPKKKRGPKVVNFVGWWTFIFYLCCGPKVQLSQIFRVILRNFCMIFAYGRHAPMLFSTSLFRGFDL